MAGPALWPSGVSCPSRSPEPHSIESAQVFSCYVSTTLPEKTTEDALTTMWEKWMESLALGFTLIQVWFLWAFRYGKDLIFALMFSSK